MPKYPCFGFPNPFYKNYRYYPNYQMETSNQKEQAPAPKEQVSVKKEKANNRPSKEEETFFDLFGIKLHFDDILLVALIYFLYNEGVKDEGLFLALILLLLS